MIRDVDMDIYLGKNRKSGILIIQDRKSRKDWLTKIEGNKPHIYI